MSSWIKKWEVPYNRSESVAALPHLDQSHVEVTSYQLTYPQHFPEKMSSNVEVTGHGYATLWGLQAYQNAP